MSGFINPNKKKKLKCLRYPHRITRFVIEIILKSNPTRYLTLDPRSVSPSKLRSFRTKNLDLFMWSAYPNQLSSLFNNWYLIDKQRYHLILQFQEICFCNVCYDMLGLIFTKWFIVKGICKSNKNLKVTSFFNKHELMHFSAVIFKSL